VTRHLIVAAVAAALFSPLVAGAADEAQRIGPQTAFFQANASYRRGDYAEAAREYEQLLASGVRSGNVYFNLGNAYFKLGDNGKAILNYIRARRFLPRDPDVQANLAYAVSLTGAGLCEAAWWEGLLFPLLFPLARRVATQPLVVAATILYTLLLAAAAAYRVFPSRPRWLYYTAVTLGMALLLTGASLMRRLEELEWRREAVVIASGETAARFEPSDTGTVHFVLKQGDQLELNAERDGWRQVSRCDGRRGWAAAATVEETLPTASRVGPGA
jgi:tetratricopeptide (TPR) repeat protein